MQSMMRGTNAKYEADMNTMLTYVNDSTSTSRVKLTSVNCSIVLQDRRANPKEKKDILSLMMTGKDKETGLGMSDDSIKRNVSLSPSYLCVSYVLFTRICCLTDVDVPHRR